MDERYVPLAERMRPQNLKEFLGQRKLVGRGKILEELLKKDEVPSLIFWGPPGSGKTSLARIIASKTKSDFYEMSAVSAGVTEVKAIIQKAKTNRSYGRKTILLIDEIHRFNKAQQGILLPPVEDGTLIFIGVTTENPSFEVISPLLSRSRVFVFENLEGKDLKKLIGRALTVKRGLGGRFNLKGDGLELILRASGGDGRVALNILELAATLSRSRLITTQRIQDAIGQYTLRFDKDAEEHYNTISAFIKSMRAGSPDAALYYLMRMLSGGEDPLFIARRMVIFASEDVGNADPHALTLAVSCFEAVERIGLPEGQIPLAQVTIYLAAAPKSRKSYEAMREADRAIQESLNEPVPLELRNPVTNLMKQVGYGQPGSELFPKKLKKQKYYYPSESGQEKKIRDRLEGK